MNSRFSELYFNQMVCWLVLTIVVGLADVGFASGLTRVDEGFTEDVEAALKQAKQEKKDIIFLYTGSDWCPPCKKLESEVLSEKEFLFEVSKDFVLVKFDFLKQTEQDPELVKQNEAWAQKYGVNSFPTLVLTDWNQKPFAFAGYETGGFQNYLGLLEEARRLRVDRDDFLKQAEGKVGNERAALLDKAISGIREEIIQVYYQEIVDEIVELDKSDELGLRTKWNESKDREMRKVIMTDLIMVSRLEKPERAIQFIDDVMKEIKFTSEEKLKIFQLKLNLVRTLKDNQKTDAVLDEMIQLEGVEGETRQRLIVKKAYLMVGTDRYDEGLDLLNSAIADNRGGLYLYLAKGELLESRKKHEEAIKSYNTGLLSARSNPDVMAELVSAKADASFAMGDSEEAMRTLDNFSDDTQVPADLRAEALLHKAMIMRDMKRVRQARLAENRAIQVVESAAEKAEMQKIVDRLRAKFGEQ